MKTANWITWIICGLLFMACEKAEGLPILGKTGIDDRTGQYVYQKTPDFSLTDQFGKKTSSKDFEGKVQVVDFFFTSCPTICPRMTNNLQLVQEAFMGNEGLAILSFSIDPTNDTPVRLREYGELRGIDFGQWTLMTGCDGTIFDIAKGYKVKAFDDTMGEERNLVHDGTFVLVDGQQRVRGYYNGLEQEDTARLIADIAILLNEE